MGTIGKIKIIALGLFFSLIGDLQAACIIEPFSSPNSENPNYLASFNLSARVLISGISIGDQVQFQFRRTRNGSTVNVGIQGGFTANSNLGSQFPVTADFSDPSADINDAGDYDVEYSATCGGVTTNFTTGTGRVSVIPAITSQPSDLVRTKNASGTMSVSVNGDAGGSIFNYEWRYNNSPIALTGFSGQNSRQLTFSTPHALEKTSYHYQVHIAHPDGDEFGYVDSDAAYFTIESSNMQTDGFCRASPSFTDGPYSYDDDGSSDDGNLVVGHLFQIFNTSYFNGIGDCQAGYRGDARIYLCNDAGRSGATSFYIRAANAVSPENLLATDFVYLRGSATVKTLLDQLTSSPVEQFEKQNAQVADTGNYSVRATAGPCQGSAVTSTAKTITVTNAAVPVVTNFNIERFDYQNNYQGQTNAPATVAGMATGGVNFSVSVSGNGPFTYQWMKNGVDIGSPVGPTGSTSDFLSIPFPSLNSVHAGMYAVRVTNSGGSTTSQIITLNINPEPPQAVYIGGDYSVITGAGINASPIVLPVGATGLTYQWQTATSNPQNEGSWTSVQTGSTAQYSATAGAPGILYLRLRVQNASNSPSWVVSSNGSVNYITITINAVTPVAPSFTQQPLSQTLVDGQTAIFTAQATGTPSPSFQWQSRASGGTFANIPGATSATYNVVGVYSLNQYEYRLVATNSAGSTTSSTAILTVTPIAPSIVSHPLNQTAAEGASVTFNVVISANATLPVSYQWQKFISGSFQNISGATASSYVVNPVAAADHGARFRVRITNPAQPSGVLSNEAVLSLNQQTCTAPSVPAPTSPANGAQNVALYPSLSWTPSTSNQNCPVTYAVRLALDSQSCSGADYLQEFSATGTAVNINAALSPLTNYKWCVRAKTTGAESSFSGVYSFQTTTAEIPAPTDLFTLPFTTVDRPAGNRQIILGAYSGERNAIGIFYLKRAQGDIEVGRTTIGDTPGGRFEVSIDVTQFSSESGAREYYARQQRVGGQAMGPASVRSVFYFYDSLLSAGLLPPALEKNTNGVTGSLRWKPVEGAASYRVYRRVGLETSANPVGAALYQPAGQASKPFSLQDGTATLQSGYMIWTDANVPANIPADGISYFVTAVDSQAQASPRSNSQSFADSVGPLRSHAIVNGNYPQQIQFVTPLTGRSALGYLCNIHPDGYFDGSDFKENSADMIGFVQVKLKSANVSCAAENYQQASQSISLPFDALKSVNTGTGFTNCLYVGEIGNLLDNTPYCFKTCLRDMNNNNETNCLEGQGVTTPNDTVPPDFAGIKNLIPQEDGTSLKAEWDPPRYQQILQEPITYVIRATDNFDQDGLPIFDGNEEIREADPSAISLVIDQLKTGAKYCVQVAARDSNQNQAGNSTTLCGQTLNNYPFIDSLGVASDPLEPQKLDVSFKVIDRQRDGVRVSKLQYKTSESNGWMEVNSVSFSGNSDFLISADSAEEAPIQHIVWDTLPYFSGHHDGFQIQLTFQDIQGNETTVQTRPVTAFAAQSRNSSVTKASHFGCTASAAKAEKSEVDFGLIALALLVLFGVARSRLTNGNQKVRGN